MAGIRIKGLAYNSCGITGCISDLIPEGLHGEIRKNSFEKQRRTKSGSVPTNDRYSDVPFPIPE